MIMDGGKILALGTADELKRGIAVGEKIVVELPGAAGGTRPVRRLSAVRGAAACTSRCEFANGELQRDVRGERAELARRAGGAQGRRAWRLGRVYSEPPTLNDVFLEITGRELRD